MEYLAELCHPRHSTLTADVSSVFVLNWCPLLRSTILIISRTVVKTGRIYLTKDPAVVRLPCLPIRILLCRVLLQVVDADGREVGPNVEGEIAVRVKPHRPVGLFCGYYVRTVLLSTECTHFLQCAAKKIFPEVFWPFSYQHSEFLREISHICYSFIIA